MKFLKTQSNTHFIFSLTVTFLQICCILLRNYFSEKMQHFIKSGIFESQRRTVWNYFLIFLLVQG